MWISCKYIYIPALLSLPPTTPQSHPSRSSQSVGLSFLCYTGTSHLAFQLLDWREKDRQREAERCDISSRHCSVCIWERNEGKLREACLQAEGALGFNDDQGKERKAPWRICRHWWVSRCRKPRRRMARESFIHSANTYSVPTTCQALFEAPGTQQQTKSSSCSQGI